MTTSYYPHTLIVLPNIGTHEVDRRVAAYIQQLVEENERLTARVAELENLNRAVGIAHITLSDAGVPAGRIHERVAALYVRLATAPRPVHMWETATVEWDAAYHEWYRRVVGEGS